MIACELRYCRIGGTGQRAKSGNEDILNTLRDRGNRTRFKRIDIGCERFDHADHQMASAAIAAHLARCQLLGVAQSAAQHGARKLQHMLLERFVKD